MSWMERSQGIDLWLSGAAGDELAGELPQYETQGFFEVRVDVSVGSDVHEVQKAIKARGWQSYSMADFVDYLIGQVRAGGMVFAVLSMAIFAVCALNIFNTQTLAVLERTYEIGILKALGAKTWEILGVFLIEAMAIGLIASQIGWLTGWAAGQGVEALIASRLANAMSFSSDVQSDQLGPLFAWSGWLWLSVTGVGILICGLAAAIPARHAARVDPIHALRAR